MHHGAMYLDILILLAAAVAIVAGFRFLRMSPVLGYLVAGVLIGPHGLALIEDVQQTAGIAEIGVVFLLFMIGLELSFSRLREMRTQVFGFGSLQMLLTGSALGLIGYGLGLSASQALVVGAVLSLSSTAIVMQVVAERGENNSQVGRIALALLILQDLAVVPLLVLIPLLAKGGDDVQILTTVGHALGRALLAMVAIVLVGRVVLRPMFRLIAQAHSPELFIAATLLVVIGCSVATESAGLSLALGAFIGGLLVAETEYKHQVEADIMPFKGLFLGLFFMTVGMSVDPMLIWQEWDYILLLTVLLLVMKASIITLLCRLFRFRHSKAIRAGFLLAQGSEFAFVTFGLAMEQGFLPERATQMLMVVVTVTMGLTPMLAGLGQRVGKYVESLTSHEEASAFHETFDLDNHVIIAGFGRVGQMLAQILELEKIPYVAVDMDPANVLEGRQRRQPVYYGDASRADVLQAMGLERADMVALTFNNPKELARAVHGIKRIQRSVRIIARSRDARTAKLLMAAGADLAVPETFEASLHLGSALLRAKGVAEHEASRIIQQVRSQHYDG